MRPNRGKKEAAEPVEAQETQQTRDLANLFVHKDTLVCALKRCIPCGYKIALHSRPGLIPNQRPEQCPRIKGTAAETSSTESASIGFYNDATVKRMLTVGDGNFSFSLAIARAFAKTSPVSVQLVVTSHESRASVIETYPDGEAILKELVGMAHVQVHHEVDATNTEQMKALGQFDRILWNFPCVRVPQGKDGQNEEMEMNKKLLSDFFANAAEMLTANGEVHVTHKTKPPFSHWGIEELASRNGLHHAHSLVFDRCLYPGYSNKKVLSKGSFPIWDSQTFVFIPASRADSYEPQHSASVKPMTKELLEKIYLLLTPTIDEKMEQEARLHKMKQRQLDPTSKKKQAKPAKKKANDETFHAIKGSAEAPGGVRSKRQRPALHMKQKGMKRQRR